MSHAFAIGYDWFYDALNEAERARLREALVEKGLQPALVVYHSGKGWPTARHNWNQVCNGGITIGALAVADAQPELAGEILKNALQSIRLAMAEYAPDGGWKEGPGYWHYATRYNVYFLAALETALGRDFGLAQLPGFEKAGLFRVYFTGPAGETFNYADAHSGAGNAAEMFWLARKFGQPLYAWHERQTMGRADPLDLLWYDPRQKGPRESRLPLHALFQGIDTAFFRSAWEDPNAVFVGFKGGDNKANHSHLDLGSFVLDAGGVRWAEDLGPDDYNLPGYFGKQRWTYFRLRTESHNTLTLDGENQDPRAAAPIVKFGDRPEFGFAVTDLAAAYGATRLERGVALVDGKQLLIQDEISLKAPAQVRWTMMTAAEVEIDGRQAHLRRGTARMEATILSPDGARFEVLPGDTGRRLIVRLKAPVAETTIAVVLSASPGEAPKLRPLREW
ncbi:MAG: heparinase II/III family protein [Acidobacteria bacterium]|nr:heparinase II/III family protein [Acidobacteriota bacterium]